MTNMRIWDALKKTDPAHTKEVGFGRKFTSIDAQWQLQRMTEQFGPIGEGWGYECAHSIERLSDAMVLAVCDVHIWWLGEHDPKLAQTSRPTRSYGPIRATCELYGPQREKGVLLFEKDGTTVKMRLDDDAPKKAMTDALTKGLSHLGLSADVFLGMYDDNKYVQKLKQEFAAKTNEWVEDAKKDGLLKNPEDTRSTYRVERDEAAKKYADSLIESFNMGNRENAAEIKREAWVVAAGKKKSPLQWLSDNSAEQYERVRMAYENATGDEF